MSDFEKSISRPPDRKKILRDARDAYKATIRDLTFAGKRLSQMSEIIAPLEEAEKASYSFLLSKQLELVQSAIKWIVYTMDQVFPAWERRRRG